MTDFIADLDEITRRILSGDDPDEVLADFHARSAARAAELSRRIAEAELEAEQCGAIVARLEGKLH